MEDRQPLVPFYHGHASLISLALPYIGITALAVLVVTFAVVWSRRAKKRDTDPAV